MSESVQVGSLAAIQAFQAALAQYIDESKQALTMIDLEIRRAVDWVRIDRAEFWKHEIRRAGDAVNRAKDELHRCISFKSMDNYTPACVDERKALQRAQQRLKQAEDKAEAVRHWSRAMQHELNEYAGRIVQFNAALDGDIPKAVATLRRMLDMLDRYMSTTAPRAMNESALARPGALNDPTSADADGENMARPLDELDQAASDAAATTTTTTPAEANPPAEFSDANGQTAPAGSSDQKVDSTAQMSHNTIISARAAAAGNDSAIGGEGGP